MEDLSLELHYISTELHIICCKTYLTRFCTIHRSLSSFGLHDTLFKCELLTISMVKSPQLHVDVQSSVNSKGFCHYIT